MAVQTGKYNVNGGLRKGYAWAHCWNKGKADMVFIGNARAKPEFWVYPGMSHSDFEEYHELYEIKHNHTEMTDAHALIAELDCPDGLENCKLGKDGWPYVYNERKKVLHEKSEKLAVAHAADLDKCREFCQITKNCSAANYRKVPKLCTLFSTVFTENYAKVQQAPSPHDTAIWKVPQSVHDNINTADPDAKVLDSPFMVKLLWPLWVI